MIPDKFSDKAEKAYRAGIRGGKLGSLLTGRHGNSHIAVIAGCAYEASYKAREWAMKLDVTLMISENDSLFYLHSDGSKTFVRKLNTVRKKVPKQGIPLDNMSKIYQRQKSLLDVLKTFSPQKTK